jgi:hypothetical protein
MKYFNYYITIILIASIPYKAYSLFCFKSEKSLTKIPKMLQNNFSFSSAGPNFGLSKRELKKTISTIKDCQSKIEDMELSQCLETDILPVLEMKLRRMKTEGIFKSNSLSFEVTDKKYFKYAPKRSLALPKELKDGLPDNWREIVAKNNNWTAIEYRSRTVANPPGPNRSNGRVLIQVDDPPYDRWIQFTTAQKCTPDDRINFNEKGIYQRAVCDNKGVFRIIPSGNTNVNLSQTEIRNWPTYEKKERLIDYISINKDEEPNKIYFSQYWRDEDGKNPIRRDKAHGQGNFDRCYSCHPSGIRQLSPVPGSVKKDDLQSFKELKDKISSYENLDWGPAITPEAYGPHLGKEQNCTSCHNNRETGRGAINYMTSKNHIDHKINGDFSMNPVFRNKEQRFLDHMQGLSQFISEEDRQEVVDQIRLDGLEDSHEAYDTVLSYLEDNNIPLPFDISDYRKTYERLIERNKNNSSNVLFADIGQQFEEKLFSNCFNDQTIITPLRTEVNDTSPSELRNARELLNNQNQPGSVNEQ